MENKNMKELLVNYNDMTDMVYTIEKEINSINLNIDSLKNIGEQISLTQATSDKVNSMEEEYEKRLNTLLDRANNIYEKQTKITDLIMGLPVHERKVIEARYIKGYRWDYIPMKIHMSRSNCFRAHDMAIDKMVEMAK